MAAFHYFQLCVLSLVLYCFCLSMVLCAESDKDEYLSAWEDFHDSWKESHTTENIFDILDRLNRITFRPLPDINIPDINRPDINNIKINDRDRYDNLLLKKDDKSGVFLAIGLSFFIFGSALFIYLKYRLETRAINALRAANAERFRISSQRSATSPSSTLPTISRSPNFDTRSVLLQFSNPITDVSSINSATDQPPRYDAVIQNDSNGNGVFPTVNPSELQTPPPPYDDDVMKKY